MKMIRFILLTCMYWSFSGVAFANNQDLMDAIIHSDMVVVQQNINSDNINAPLRKLEKLDAPENIKDSLLNQAIVNPLIVSFATCAHNEDKVPLAKKLQITRYLLDMGADPLIAHMKYKGHDIDMYTVFSALRIIGIQEVSESVFMELMPLLESYGAHINQEMYDQLLSDLKNEKRQEQIADFKYYVEKIALTMKRIIIRTKQETWYGSSFISEFSQGYYADVFKYAHCEDCNNTFNVVEYTTNGERFSLVVSHKKMKDVVYKVTSENLTAVRVSNEY